MSFSANWGDFWLHGFGIANGSLRSMLAGIFMQESYEPNHKSLQQEHTESFHGWS